MDETPHIPERIEIIHRGDLTSVLVDGQEIGGWIPRDSVAVLTIAEGRMPRITITLTAPHISETREA